MILQKFKYLTKIAQLVIEPYCLTVKIHALYEMYSLEETSISC